jgi:predicted acyltransferase
LPEAAAASAQVSPTAPEPASQATRTRLISLDAFRAIVVGLMIFMDHPLIPGAVPWWLLHPEWHGFRLADVIAPAFMFIVGMSLAFSARRLTDESHGAATRQVIKRVVILFLIGVALGFYKSNIPSFSISLMEPFNTVRVMGVLQRIAIGSAVAWVFIRKDWRWTVGAAAVLLAVHSYLLLFVPAPGVIPGAWTATPLGPQSLVVLEKTSLAAWVDTSLWGIRHTYRGVGFDPEGALGLLSVSAQVLLGLTLGKFLVKDDSSGKMLRPTLMWGAVGIVAGIMLGLTWLPINKYLWTASFVLLSSGLAAIVFAVMYWWIDLKGNTFGFRWLVPLGRNALLLYIAENAFSATLGLIAITRHGKTMTVASWISQVMTRYMTPTAATLLFSAVELAAFVVIAEILYRRKIFFKF